VNFALKARVFREFCFKTPLYTTRAKIQMFHQLLRLNQICREV